MIGVSGVIDAEKKEEKVQTLNKKNSNIVEEDFVQSQKKMIVKPPEKREVASEEEEPLGFGGYIRILFIIAMAIIIFVLVGGQAAQMSKSWEK